MEFIGGPAALGGILLCVALGGWALGRWQGGLRPGTGPRAATAAAGEAMSPVIEERAAPLADDVVASLGALHDEVSAYRRAQQVLRGTAEEDIGMALSRAAGGAQAPLRGSRPAQPEAAGTGLAPECALQPSPAVPSSALMRV